jgi:hypothetical protein
MPRTGYQRGEGGEFLGKFTKKQVEDAISGSGGILKKVASRLGVHRITVQRYFEKFPEFRDKLEQEKEIILDQAETKLFELFDSGNEFLRLKTIQFFLSRRGKNRGYGEKEEERNIEEQFDLLLKILGKEQCKRKR